MNTRLLSEQVPNIIDLLLSSIGNNLNPNATDFEGAATHCLEVGAHTGGKSNTWLYHAVIDDSIFIFIFPFNLYSTSGVQ